jgi:hypothetical protein
VRSFIVSVLLLLLELRFSSRELRPDPALHAVYNRLTDRGIRRIVGSRRSFGSKKVADHRHAVTTPAGRPGKLAVGSAGFCRPTVCSRGAAPSWTPTR